MWGMYRTDSPAPRCDRIQRSVTSVDRISGGEQEKTATAAVAMVREK
jgi:hypothetical protein